MHSKYKVSVHTVTHLFLVVNLYDFAYYLAFLLLTFINKVVILLAHC